MDAAHNIKWRLFDEAVDKKGFAAMTSRQNDGTIQISFGVLGMFEGLADARRLFNTVGHELIHANDLYNCLDENWKDAIGSDYDWISEDKDGNQNGAQKALHLIMEEHAYKWGTYIEDQFGKIWGESQQYRSIMNEIKAYGLEWLLTK